MLHAVVFDIGETLVDETRHWGEWADALAIPHLTFFGVLGALIERREHHRRVFDWLAPDADLEALRADRLRRGLERFEVSDLYPDVEACLHALHDAGLWIGVAGNQPQWTEAALVELALPVDGIASSARWGVEKPSAEFFARVQALAGVPASQIAYVGDRLDNDVLPARQFGMIAVHLKRGPWGHAHARWPEVERAHVRIDGLALLLDALRELDV